MGFELRKKRNFEKVEKFTKRIKECIKKQEQYYKKHKRR